MHIQLFTRNPMSNYNFVFVDTIGFDHSCCGCRQIYQSLLKLKRDYLHGGGNIEELELTFEVRFWTVTVLYFSRLTASCCTA